MSHHTSDFIIIGGGLYGSSLAYNLAKNGAKNVTVLERNVICSGGTAKSCAIVRTHYSIKSNLIHAVASLKIFSNFPDIVGGDCGWHQTGYIILGPEEHREPMLAVFCNQNEHGIDTQVLDAQQVHDIHPLLSVDDVGVIGYDTLTGYCDPYLTTTTYMQRAKELGVAVHTNSPVQDFKIKGELKIIETPRGTFESPTVILTAGPWTNTLTKKIGVELPYEISRHKVITLKSEQPYSLAWPIVKDLTTPEKIYFRPDTGGVVLIGTGDHGDPIADPETLTDHVDLEHIEHIGKLISHRMPQFQSAVYHNGWTGPYDIPPDWNPMVGPVPEVEGVYVAVGLSGHGFKLAPSIGESLAQLVLGLEPRVPIDSYALSRFREGRMLHGAYGIGSIS